MLMETNWKWGMVKNCCSRNNFPVSNSLMYSIYKMLPNDTDLTVLENKSIQGYNFAFIDDHYNYHTAQDDINHLNKKYISTPRNVLNAFVELFSNAI
jgi:hypothetical protein